MKRSSRSPNRSLTTPTNYRKAMPAIGSSVSAIVSWVLSTEVNPFSASGASVIDLRRSTMLRPNRTAKTTPARPADRGVVSVLASLLPDRAALSCSHA